MRTSPNDAGSIGPGYVSALLPAGDGLWVGVGGSGLFRRDAATGRFEAFRHDPAAPHSLSGDYVTALLAAPDGRLWVGTRSDGLNRCRIAAVRLRALRRSRTPARPSLGHHHVTALRDGRPRRAVGRDQRRRAAHARSSATTAGCSASIAGARSRGC